MAQATASQRRRFAASQAAHLLYSRLPLVFVQLVTLITLAGYVDEHIVLGSHVHACEYFSGRKAVSHALLLRGYRTVSFDIEYNDLMNMNDTGGFILACMLGLLVEPGGIGWFAPVCSSWTWVCRAITARCMGIAEGSTRVNCVNEGNIMASRVV